jgi:hypothetical protein
MSLDLTLFMTELAVEVDRADAKHGTWTQKTNKEKVEHVYNEFEELEDAAERKDVNGEHGMKIEALHVACTAYKLWRSL